MLVDLPKSPRKKRSGNLYSGNVVAKALERNLLMTLMLVMVFEISVAMAIGFVLGRIWQIRCDLEQERAGDFTPTQQASNDLDGPGRREVMRTVNVRRA
jgi:hypothetical protein